MTVHEKSSKDKLALGLSWLAFLLSLALAYAAFADGTLPRDFLYDSDALNLPSMYRDLFREHGSFFAWRFSAAPFFFPDMLLYFLINFLIPNFHLAIVFYGVAQSILFVLGLMLLSNRIFGSRAIIHCFILLSGTLFFIHDSRGVFAWADNELCLTMLSSIYHVGVLLVGIYVLALIMAGLDHDFARGNRRRGLAILAGILVLSILTVASDMLYVLQVTIPAILAMFFLFLISRVSFKRWAGLSLVLLASVPMGKLMDRMFANIGQLQSAVKLTPRAIGDAMQAIVQWAGDVCKAHWGVAIAWAAFMAISLAVSMIAVYKASRQKPFNRHYAFFFAFILLLVTINFTALIATGQHAPRYFIFSYVMPSFFGWPLLLGGWRWLVDRLDRFCVHHVVAGGLSLFMAVSLCASPTRNFKSLAKLRDYYPDSIRRLDEYARRKNLKNGISDYWPARRVTMLSKAGLRVIQVDRELRPRLWINSRAWYDRPFDFVLLENLNESKILQRFGQPRDALKIDNKPVAFVYDSPEFRDQFKGNEVNASFTKPNDAFEFYPAQIGGGIGEAIGFGRGAGFKPTPKGNLLVGPHLWLPKGDYRYAIRASASGGDGKPVGAWAVLASRATISLGQGAIAAGAVGVHEGRFSLKKPTSVEFRVDYAGSGALKVDGIRLKRE
jgi:hypothetical protein